ncbi:multidrug effflux MFS transporter [Mycetocola spongiae]|uniref:multidrug effflux MFS transporter n=1 Tax=Mycetocola spongiae TaxID=2859226 RepID=UPI001CF58A81|nr:multidrug effflux MFS transporter [Mycetocola spongiae]
MKSQSPEAGFAAEPDSSTPPRATAPDRLGGGLLIMLALLSALAPFAIDLYLPAFPEMVGSLGTTATGVQLTLTAFLLGLALGQLVFGPLSDRIGRRLPLIIGALLCVLASALAALSPNVEVLIAARVIQGLTGAAGMVIGRAIIADLAVGAAAARGLNLMMIVGGIAPVIGPVAGSLLVGPLGWRGLLWVVAGLAVLMLLAVIFGVPESHGAAKRRALIAGRHLTGSPYRALVSRSYLGYTLVFALSFAAFMGYIAASPFIYQTMMGFGPVAYGLSFAANAAGIAVFSGVSARLTATRSVRSLLGVGLVMILIGGLAVLLIALTGVPPITLLLPLFIMVAGMGFIFGNATALALDAAPGASGTGSAILGFLQYVLGALVSGLVGLAGETSALPLGLVMFASAVLAVAAFLLAGPRRTPAR